MSENQYLEIIENKLDSITLLVEQQAKSSVFFDGFTKQVLEKIHRKLEYISNFESNELISYLSEELKRNLESRQEAVQDRLDLVQSQISKIHTSLGDSLKTPEIANVFTKLSDSILGFSRDLSAQTRYLNTTVDEIKTTVNTNKVDEKISLQTEVIRNQIISFKNNVQTLSEDINSSFTSLRRLIENNTAPEAIVSLAADISVLQNGMNDVLTAVSATTEKQAQIIENVSNLAAAEDVKDIKLDVAVLVAEMQVLKESVRLLVSKSDLESLNEKLNFAIESVSNLKELSAFNDGENKSILNSCFSNIMNAISSLFSKEDGHHINGKLDVVLSNGEANKAEIQKTVGDKFQGLDEKVEVLANNLQKSSYDNKEQIISLLGEIKTTTTELAQAETSQKIEAMRGEVKEIIGHSASHILEKFEQNKQVDDEFKETIRYELKKSIEEITTKLFGAGDEYSDVKSTLLYEFQKSYNSLNEKLESQSKKTDDLKEEISNVVVENFNVMDEKIQNKYNKLQAGLIKDISCEINIGEVKSAICKDILENAAVLGKKIDEAFEVVTTNESIFEKLSKDTKDLILEQLGQIKASLEAVGVSSTPVEDAKNLDNKLEGISDNILDALSNDLDASFTDNIKIITETIEDKISYIRDDIQEIVFKISQVDSVADKVKEVVASQLDEQISSIDIRISGLGEDIKKYVETAAEDITAKITQYQKDLESLSDIDLGGYNEETRNFVKEQIQILTQKIDELEKTGDFSAVSEELKGTVLESSEKINKRLEILRDIILNDMNDDSDITAQLDEIQSAVESISKNTEETASLKDVLAQYRNEIDAISNIDFSSLKAETQDFIQSELKQLKEQFVINLTSVFENISFVEESEELQNAIYDNADNIKADIKSELNNLKDELIANSNSSVDIDEKFENLKSIIENIMTGTSSTSEKYVYTLPDVETDIAKMRMAIGDITDMLQQNKDDGYDVAERLNAIDTMRDDISSISKRTNKLILTSEDANKHLKENLAEFKGIVEEISEKCNQIDSTQLNRNITDVKALVMSTLKSDRILNEAFMHLASWIDDSASTLNGISETTTKVGAEVAALKDSTSELKTSIETLGERIEGVENSDSTAKLSKELDEVKAAIADLVLKAEKRGDVDYSKSLYDIEYSLDKISDKLDVQELKIKALEKKIDNVASSSDNQEMTSLLEFIASQATAANENSRTNRLLVQKMELMELQMKGFERTLSKITAFVDEDN